MAGSQPCPKDCSCRKHLGRGGWRGPRAPCPTGCTCRRHQGWSVKRRRRHAHKARQWMRARLNDPAYRQQLREWAVHREAQPQMRQLRQAWGRRMAEHPDRLRALRSDAIGRTRPERQAYARSGLMLEREAWNQLEAQMPGRYRWWRAPGTIRIGNLTPDFIDLTGRAIIEVRSGRRSRTYSVTRQRQFADAGFRLLVLYSADRVQWASAIAQFSDEGG